MYIFDANRPKIELHSIRHYKNSLWVSQKKYYRELDKLYICTLSVFLHGFCLTKLKAQFQQFTAALG